MGNSFTCSLDEISQSLQFTRPFHRHFIPFHKRNHRPTSHNPSHPQNRHPPRLGFHPPKKPRRLHNRRKPRRPIQLLHANPHPKPDPPAIPDSRRNPDIHEERGRTDLDLGGLSGDN